MKKTLVAAIAALVAIPSLTSIVLAAPPEQAGGPRQFSVEDRAAFTDARIAALKAGLKLTAAQEKYWPGFETALRDVAKARAAMEEVLLHNPAPQWREQVERILESLGSD